MRGSSALCTISLLLLICCSYGYNTAIESTSIPTPEAPSAATTSNCTGSINYASFVCFNQTWTHYGDLEVRNESLKISSDRPAIVTGNIMLAKGLRIELIGPFAGIAIGGCVLDPTGQGIYIDYRKGWPRNNYSWTQHPFSQNVTCITRVPYQVATPKGCIGAEENVTMTGFSDLSITFTTSRKACIIVITLSAVGGALALLLIIAAALCIRRCARNKQSGYEPVN